MPLDPDFLSLLVCPRTKKPLRAATAEELAAVNRAIDAGGVVARGGEPVTSPVEEALRPEGEPVVYPIRDGIPVLLADEAVPLPGAPGAATGSTEDD